MQKPERQDRLLAKKLSYFNAWLKNKNYKPPAFFSQGKKLSKGSNLTETLGRSGSTKRGHSGRTMQECHHILMAGPP
jgi:hypothetical protein